jgi:hypothetical protein
MTTMTRATTGGWQVWDIDGVVVNCRRKALDVINRELGTSFTENDWWSYNLAECLGPDADKVFFELMQGRVPNADLWRDAPLYAGVADLMARERAVYGQRIAVCTALPEAFHGVRADMLRAAGVPMDAYLPVASSKQKVEAVAHLAPHGETVVIDDLPPTLRQFKAAGARVLLPALNYNLPDAEEFGEDRGELATLLARLHGEDTVALAA